jgi:hypothetical protein
VPNSLLTIDNQVEHSAIIGPVSCAIFEFPVDLHSIEYKYIPRNANGESKMPLSLTTRITTSPIWIHVTAAAGSVALFQGVKGALDRSYAESMHPVDYVTGQTSFDAATIKGYYAIMEEAGTLGVYGRTQIIDYGFIVAMCCLGLFVFTLIARLGREGSLGRRIGIWAGLVVLMGAICDAIENGWSFVMLANPTDFANWLALPYSGFASVKFALITLGMLILVISVVTSIAGRLIKKPSLG